MTWEWQQINVGDEEEWVLGEKVRGIVRYPRGIVYCNLDHNELDGSCCQWRWIVLTVEQAEEHGGETFLKGNNYIASGWEGKKDWAIDRVEEEMRKQGIAL